jgi:DNA adenine methylase
MTLFDDLVNINRADETYERKIVRAAFPMPGSKSRSVETILPILESFTHNIWVDHCGGTGTVSWNKSKCKKMVFNDRYSAIADFYIALRDHPKDLEAEVKSLHPRCRQLWEHCYSTWNDETDLVRRAAKWFYMATLSVNGKRLHYGFSTKDNVDIVSMRLRAWDSLHPIVKNFEIENMDVFDSLTTFDSSMTLHYVDPPYLNTDQKTYEHQWVKRDMQKLIDLASTLEGTVAISHCEDLWLDSLTWNEVHEWEITTTVGKTKSGRLKEKLYVTGQN